MFARRAHVCVFKYCIVDLIPVHACRAVHDVDGCICHAHYNVCHTCMPYMVTVICMGICDGFLMCILVGCGSRAQSFRCSSVPLPVNRVRFRAVGRRVSSESMTKTTPCLAPPPKHKHAKIQLFGMSSRTYGNFHKI